jgi:hypothetical protein
MGNLRTLHAYALYDNHGRIVPGSVLLRTVKPTGGNWQLIGVPGCGDGTYLCCQPTTTTTTSSTTTTTTTA